MRRIVSSDPERMVYRSGGGCLMLFGLPFLVAGAFMIVAPFLEGRFQMKDSKTGRPMPPAVGLAMGAAFAAVGIGLMFGRSGKTLDRRADTLTAWWGLLVPFRRKEHRLSAFERVTLSREIRHSKNSTYTVYPVRLEGAGVPKVTLEEPRDMNAARALGEEAAKFLGRPLADSSTGSQVVRQPGELDESLRERARRTGERPQVPPPSPAAGAPPASSPTPCASRLPPRGSSGGTFSTSSRPFSPLPSPSAPSSSRSSYTPGCPSPPRPLSWPSLG